MFSNKKDSSCVSYVGKEKVIRVTTNPISKNIEVYEEPTSDQVSDKLKAVRIFDGTEEQFVKQILFCFKGRD